MGIMSSMQKLETHRWTREAYERLIERGALAPDERVELIEGEILDMTPQSAAHATVIRLASAALSRVLGDQYMVQVQLPLALGSLSEPEPDISVVPGSPRDYRKAHPSLALLIVEVADTSLDYDREWKAGVYARAGVPEYWIINLIDRHVELYRNPEPDNDARLGWQYAKHRTAGPGEYISPLLSSFCRNLGG